LHAVELIELDVTDERSVQRAKFELEGKISSLDVLKNNAGIGGTAPQNASEISIDNLHVVYETNFFGVIRVTQHFLELLKRSDEPRIVNITSSLGSLTNHSDPGAPYYESLKYHTSNMEFPFEYITPDIKLFRNQGKEFKMEVLFDCHMLVWFISGETRIHQADQTYLFKAGDIFLIPRNQLATIINYPKAGSPYTSVVMQLSTAQLRAIYADLNVKTYGSATQNILKLDKHPLLESCLASLIPYFDLLEKFPENIASLKITEAISILRTVDKSVDEILANLTNRIRSIWQISWKRILCSICHWKSLATRQDVV
jgi:hypothetical protein